MATSLPAPSSRNKVLDVAEQLFARRGYAGVGLREVAEQAGLSKSALFHHFRGKDQLYCEVLARVLARIDTRLTPVLATDLQHANRLAAWVEALIDVLAEHPSTARLLMRELVEDEQFDSSGLPEAAQCERVLSGIVGGIRDLLAQGVAAGAFRDVSIAQTVQTLIGATVYHFASGQFGDDLLGRPLLSAEAIRSRKEEIVTMLQYGLVAESATGGETEESS